MKTRFFIVFVLLLVFWGGCGGEKVEIYEREIDPNATHYPLTKDAWQKFLKPDMVPVNVRVCRTPEGTYMRWDIVLTIQNQRGNDGLDDLEENKAPIDVIITFDPDRPWGCDPVTGEQRMLGEYENLLTDEPEQQYMSVPRAGMFGGASFSLWYPDIVSDCSRRRIPTLIKIYIDKYKGTGSGIIDEYFENNNEISVIIDRYDEINGRTGKFLIGCWYSE